MAIHRRGGTHSPADPDDSVIPLESEEIKRESIDKQVFIFNVGPLSHARPMSSYGTITIPALEASSCLHSDLRVAGPVTIPGRPSECYPDPFSEKWRRLYHQPIDGTPPGIDFALQVIGADRRGAMSGDLRSEGVFISQVRVATPEMHSNVIPQWRHDSFNDDTDTLGSLPGGISNLKAIFAGYPIFSPNTLIVFRVKRQGQLTCSESVRELASTRILRWPSETG
jgi:hypothetical protein